MIILGIDPGPLTCGVCGYDTDTRTAMEPVPDCLVADVLDRLRAAGEHGAVDLVAIERVQSYGIAGADLLETSEVVGRLHQRALDSGLQVVRLYRREILQALDVTGRGCRDAVVRQRLLEMHPGGKGTTRAPGLLCGVSGHAWQALAVAVAASLVKP